MDKINQIRDKLSLLLERRSVRHFKPDPVPHSLLLELIGYAALAPSACNLQAWRFIIVSDPGLRQKLVDAGGSVLINKAPAGIMVTYQNTTRNTHYHDDFQTAGACIQNLLLAAQANGLGACWLCTLPSMNYLRKLFNIPVDYSPMAYIILGYPAGDTLKEMPRKEPLQNLVAENSFPARSSALKQSRLLLWGERVLIWIYNRTPVAFKKKFLNRIVDGKFTRKFEN